MDQREDARNLGQFKANGKPKYAKQAELMKAAGITSVHTFNDIMTKAALKVPTMMVGFAVAYNAFDGYRLVDKPEQRELKQVRRRVATARTMLARGATMLMTRRAPLPVTLIGQTIQAIVASCEMVLVSLDQVI
jgi:cytosine/adenosine deaminase-related metal-dependent hydrolase